MRSFLVALLGLAALSRSSPTVFRDASVQENGKRANVPIPDPASRVNLFIGTTSSGHAFPGEF